jgi:hypothetical protein
VPRCSSEGPKIHIDGLKRRQNGSKMVKDGSKIVPDASNNSNSSQLGGRPKAIHLKLSHKKEDGGTRNDYESKRHP